MSLARVVGIETEYGVASAHLSAVPDGSAPPLSAEDAVTEIFRHTPQRHRSAHHFLPNGARLYVDIGSHPEYAGAECRHLADVLAQDRAGDAILADMLAVANADLAPRGMRIHLLKSNADARGNTFGCHENYQFSRSRELPTAGFVGFLAARQILTGAGMLPFPGEDRPATSSPLAPMFYSARAPYMTAATSADPTRERAFINTRDEPHADRARWRRLHVIAGDSAMCEATTAVKVMLADAVLSLIEAGDWDLAEVELTDPIAALAVWNLDPNARAERTGGRDPISCPDLLTLVCDRIADHLAPDELTARAFDLARRGIAALETGDYADVATELDWAIKHRVLSHVAASAPAGWDGPRVLRTDLAFHDISARTGLAAGLRTAGQLARWVSEEQVAAARMTPPADTRAQLRGAFVAACERTGRSASIGWAHLRLDRPPRPQLELPDPLTDHDPAVAALIAEIDSLGPAAPEPAPPRPAPLDALPERTP
ncbi:Pup--protein ligase [Bowdeniella nasicola]|uniref:Pup--protein ligase n=1 Tax=Bowdeniella nasicola TaxID=208480 RepID=A0A1Q5Q0E6_9ACTO|nr:proteasome accessory factor PafA2 family protein [Bowdeniella nasicola]OKL53267.1 Pup--protein ligase [Bowdeniella nasicola]